jgi:electron transfer flavoprotein beta subunit
MKILVCVKRVVDYNVRIRVKADASGVELANVKMSMNPFDEIAVEEAVRLKEKGVATEVVVATIGADAAQEQLRSALAMGCDRAVHIHTDTEIQPLGAAKLLKKLVEKEAPEMVIIGKQAIDDDASQTGQMLAGLLGWGQGTFASLLTFSSPLEGEGRVGGEVLVTREIDGGLVTVKLKLPCVVSTDLRLNEPRYPALPNIMKARSKPLEKLTADSFGVDIALRFTHEKFEEPKKRSGGKKVKDVAELVDKLRNEARVI